MNLRSTRAIVLKTGDHGEADKLVTMFSSDLGRVTAIAKSAKKSKRRFVNKLEEFSLLEIQYRLPRGSSLLFLSEADLVRSHLSLRLDTGRYAAAAYISELLLRFTRDHDADAGLFLLLRWALDAIDSGQNPRKILVLFHLRLLTAVGYHPELSHCGGCGSPIRPGGRFRLAPGKGALLCDRCRPLHDGFPAALSVQILKFLATAQQSDLWRLNRLQLAEPAANVALEALYLYSSHLLQQDLHSWPFLRSLAQRHNAARIAASLPQGQ